MSKKDYQAIARAIYQTLTPRCEVCEVGFVELSGNVKGCPAHGIRGDKNAAARANLLETLIPVLKADNPRFDWGRFVEACETGKCKGMRPANA